LSFNDVIVSAPFVFDQSHQAVVLGAARRTRAEVHRHARVPVALDEAIEHGLGEPAAAVALVDREQRFQRVAVPR
jgi:hypothetical protein